MPVFAMPMLRVPYVIDDDVIDATISMSVFIMPFRFDITLPFYYTRVC